MNKFVVCISNSSKIENIFKKYKKKLINFELHEKIPITMILTSFFSFFLLLLKIIIIPRATKLHRV